VRHFMKIQWIMVAVVIVAIRSWGVPPIPSQMSERRRDCQAKAVFYASVAARCRAQAKAFAGTQDRLRAKELERENTRKSQAYRRVLRQPWRLYPTVEIP
jgi:hypothetical protein